MTKVINYSIELWRRFRKRLGVFTLIGILATVVHFLTVFTTVHFFNFQPLFANIVAFLTAFLVSYYGHKHHTFADLSYNQNSLLRYFQVALLGFAINEFLYYLFLTYLHIHYLLALLVVLMIVPGFTFLFSYHWAFAND